MQRACFKGTKDSVTIFTLVFTLSGLEKILVMHMDIQMNKRIKKHILCSFLADNMSICPCGCNVGMMMIFVSHAYEQLCSISHPHLF